jgi:hypothetical protein
MRNPEILMLHRPSARGHLVQFYDDPAIVLENVEYLIAKAFEAGNSAVIVATQNHRAAVTAKLLDRGFDLDSLRKTGRFVSLDGADTLAQLMVAGRPDPERFDSVVGSIIREALAGSAQQFVFAFGEMVALLCATNNVRAAIELEKLWNSLGAAYPFSLYCAYPLDCLVRNPDAQGIFDICEQHTTAVPAESPL